MAKRISRLQGMMENVDCVLVTSPEDVYYYSGYMPVEDEPTVLLILGKDSRLFTTSNGFQEKHSSAKITLMEKSSDFFDFVKNYRNVGFDEGHMKAGSYLKLAKMKLRMVPFSEKIKLPRAVKDPEEVDRIRESVKLTKSAFSRFRKVFVGMKENRLAAEIDCFFVKNNAANAFDTIVASGRNSSSVHHVPVPRKISSRDMTVVDIGAKLGNYCSDMTRTWCRMPGKREKGVIENAENIQKELMDMVRPGVRMKDVQERYDSLLKKRGYKSFHSFGHGVGLDVHEKPLLGDEIKEGMVLTVEPGIYVKNFGGCRMEDMVLVKKGSVRVF
jgi:Xaa-Pro aminopeptidase